ncbi:MAG: DUF1648 domain-containing protein [Clostridium sp.]
MEMKKSMVKMDGTKVFKVLNIASAIALLVALADTIMNYSKLPENVPMHLSLNGQLGNYASDKALIFTFIVLGIIAFIGMSIYSKFPSKMNYSVKITDENRERQYKLASKFMKVMSFEVAFGLSYFQFALNRVVIAGGDTVGPICTLFILILVGSSIYHLVRSTSLK